MRIYVKQVPPDIQKSHFNINLYPGEVTITGNSNFNEYKSNLYKHVEEHLEDAYMEFDELGDGEQKPDDTHLDKLIQSHFGILPRNADERIRWRKTLSCCILTSPFTMASAISLVSGKPYHMHTIHGNCQSDWSYVICPDEMTVGTPSVLEMIESEYFNTGSEWMAYESEDTFKSEDCGTAIYVLNMQDPRKVIADFFWVMPAEVEMYAFDRYEKIPKYKRMEDVV